MAWEQDIPLAALLSQTEKQLQWKPTQTQCGAKCQHKIQSDVCLIIKGSLWN